MAACGSNTIKYLLFIFNFIFALGGLVLLIIGALIQWNLSPYSDFFSTNIIIPPIILIVVGAVIFLISFLGCCGAIKESHCMLVTFAVLLVIIFIIQIAGGILAFIYRDEIQANIKHQMKESQALYTVKGPEGDSARTTWDTLQQEFKCCGVDSPTEWTIQYGIVPPDSCKCPGVPLLTPGCETGVYSSGCYPKLVHYIETAEIALGAIAISVAIIELIGVIFGLILANAIRNQEL